MQLLIQQPPGRFRAADNPGVGVLNDGKRVSRYLSGETSYSRLLGHAEQGPDAEGTRRERTFL